MDRYEKVELGYLDNQTNLIWKEFEEEGTYTYNEALALHKDGWRLPTIEELLSIVDYSIYGPATKLPNTKESFVWSASASADGSNYAWYVYFYFGSSNYSYRDNSSGVRLVRNQ